MNRFLRFLPSIIGCTTVLLLAGCRETNQELFDRYRPQVEVMSATLNEVSAKLPESVDAPVPPKGPIDPPVDYREDAGAPTNTDFLMFRHLTDPYFDYGDRNLMDLRMSNHLLNILEWSGPENPMVHSVLKKKARKSMDDEWAATLETRYLAVARIAKYEPVVATGAQLYTRGFIRVEGHLVDLKEKKVLLSFPVESYSSESVSFEYDQNRENPEDRMVAHARSSMWSEIRIKFAAQMEALSGGTFQLR